MPEKTQQNQTDYSPSDAQKDRINFVLTEREDMLKKRNQPYVQFNDRTLKEFIDDSEKRMNAYVLPKKAQGKEPWQANFATRAYANKTKALLAAIAKNIPEMEFSAVNQDNQFHHFVADVSKQLVRHSYNQGNPQEEFFFLAWSTACRGTVLSYEGVEQQSFTKKEIKSFDLLTGDVQEEEIEHTSYGEPISYEIPLMNLLIKNFYIRDIQDQPSIIFESYYADKERFDASFGKYPNVKYVKDVSFIKKEEHDTYFHSRWQESAADGKGYVVSRYMNKYNDVYRIIANGVELYNGPMLWTDITCKNFGRKAYPIAKTVYEPFATTDFFYGNSQPNSAMGEGDVLNTLYNTSLDKHYRSMVPPLLIGMVNKDMLDLEDEVVAGDTKIYVDDINQVKQMELKGISDSDVKMIDLISRGLDMTTLDPQQQGVAQKYVTARAAVASDEAAKQLKGVFFMFMESLWLQKIRLRVPNVIIAYTKPRLVEILGEEGEKKLIERFQSFNVKGASLSSGSKGTLGVEFRSQNEIRGNKQGLKTNVEAEEQMNNAAGKPYEKVIMPFGFLDQYAIDVEIIPETIWQSSQSIMMALTIEKIASVQKFFPEYFSPNKEKFFTDLVKAYSDDPTKYELPKPMNFNQEQGLTMAQNMAGKAKGGGGQPSQVVGDITGSDQNNRLSGLMGQ